MSDQVRAGPQFHKITKAGRSCKKKTDNEQSSETICLFLNPMLLLNRLMSGMKISFLKLILLFVTLDVTAQQYPIKNYSIEDGLSHSNVYRIFQDKRGFLWFCTDYGLCSYNGKSFNSYDRDSLLSGPVLSMSEDLGGRKLISSLKEGIIVLTDSGSQKLPLPQNTALSQVLYSVFKKNRTWAISREQGYQLYEITDKKVKQVSLQTDSGEQVLFNRIIETDTELLFTTNQGVYRLLDTVIEPYFKEIITEAVQDIRKSADGNYWAAIGNKIIEIKNNKIIHTYSLKPDQLVSTLLCDKKNNLWVALYGQGVILIKDGKQEDITPKLAIRSILINDMREDNEGNIWIATYDAGVYKLHTLDVLDYSLGNGKKQNLLCYSLEKHKDQTLLIGTMGAAFFWEEGIKKPVATLEPDELVYFVKSYGDTVYIGTSRHFYVGKNNKAHKTYRYKGNEVASISFCKDHSGKIWIGNYVGLFHVEGEKLIQDTFPALLKSKRYNVITEDRKHNLWFGTRTGLIKYDGSRFREIVLPAQKNFRNIHDIKQDSHGRIWVATDGGLLCFDGDRCRIFTVLQGLTHNKCNKIIEDHNNTLWIGTLRGLNHLDLNTFEIQRYGGGIFPKEVISLYCDDQNILFVGTAEGLSSIKTSRVVVDDSPPPLYITSIKTSEKLVNMPKSVSLKYNENELRIDFIALNYNPTNTVEYRYKIMNTDDNWYYTKNNTLELPSLPSGQFTFILYARKNNGPWGPAAVLKIEVSTPFWKTWWFILLILAGSGALLIKIVKTRQDSINRRKTSALLRKMNEKLEKRAEELASSNAELEQFAYVASHDLQEPLRMVTSFMTLLETGYADNLDDTAKKYIFYARDGATRMRQIILDLLEYSRVGRIKEKASVDMNVVVKEAIELNAVTIKEKSAVIDADDLPTVTGNASALRQVFQNLIGNGLKYQRRNVAPVIRIRVIETETHWQFEVTDNGIGIESKYFDKIFIIFQRLHTKDEFSGTGIGLAICKKIVENHNGSIWVESEPGKSTSFYFTIAKEQNL